MTFNFQTIAIAVAAIAAVIVSVFYFGDSRGYDRAMTEVALAPRDTVVVHDTVDVPGLYARLDSAMAELKGKDWSIKGLNKMVWTREATIAFYQSRLDELNDSLAKPPVAVLDTTLVDPVNKDTITVHTEYAFPPVNMFLNTSVLVPPRSVPIEYLYITRTVVTKPAWWVKPVILASGIAAGYFIAEERYWESGLAAVPGVILLSIEP